MEYQAYQGQNFLSSPRSAARKIRLSRVNFSDDSLSIVDEIIGQITPERVKQELEAVRETRFPPELQRWIEKYQTVGERDDFVFRWCYKINRNWLLAPVPSSHRDSLAETKTLFNIFIVLLDDVSEDREKGRFLEELLKIPFYGENVALENLSKKEKDYLEFTSVVWNEISKRLKGYPRYSDIEDFFKFDVWQFLDAVRYGYLMSKYPGAANQTEYWTFFPRSMQIMIDADIDLMCSREFDLKELGRFREVILLAQEMARIGNWLTTWEREVQDDDFTSIVVPFALYCGAIDFDDLKGNSKNLIKKIKSSGAEGYFLDEWSRLHSLLELEGQRLKSLDHTIILGSLEHLLFMHLASRGYK